MAQVEPWPPLPRTPGAPSSGAAARDAAARERQRRELELLKRVYRLAYTAVCMNDHAVKPMGAEAATALERLRGAILAYNREFTTIPTPPEGGANWT